ncbi:MAG: DnaJ domain-containing protein, partial [bacterium]
MTDSDDYYEILGVSRDASQSEIKSAFKEMAQEYHPDQSDDPEAEKKFKKISEAYEVLSDEQMRQKYDRFGKEGVNRSAAGQRGRAGVQDIGDILEQMGFGDFADFFGGRGGGGRRGGRRRKRNQRGQDLRMKVELDLEEAVFGTTKQFDIEKNEPCENCNGSGSLSGGTKRCRTCDGKGKVTESQGFFKVTETCPDFRGKGEI